MHQEKLDFGSADIISSLPEALISKILSFLPIEESALTSVLAKKWRYLFAFTPNLEFDDSAYRHPLVVDGERERILRNFMSFVDSVLRLQENSTVNKFSLTCGHGVNPDRVIDWISNVLERGVSVLDIRVRLRLDYLPTKVFVSKSLVRLRIECGNVTRIDVKDVFLPKLKTLYLNRVTLGEAVDCFDKLTSGCPVLEELALNAVFSCYWNGSMTSKTLKRLSLRCLTKNPDSISFDMPNLVHLEYYDYVAVKYPKVNFGSLVVSSGDQSADANYGYLAADATNFIMGIRNVQILH